MKYHISGLFSVIYPIGFAGLILFRETFTMNIKCMWPMQVTETEAQDENDFTAGR